MLADRRGKAEILFDRRLEVAGAVSVLVDGHRALKIAAEDLGFEQSGNHIRVAAPRRECDGLTFAGGIAVLADREIGGEWYEEMREKVRRAYFELRYFVNAHGLLRVDLIELHLIIRGGRRVLHEVIELRLIAEGVEASEARAAAAEIVGNRLIEILIELTRVRKRQGVAARLTADG